MANKLGTLRDVAEQLGISIDTAWRWVNENYLPSINLGRDTGKGRRRRTIRFNMEQVGEWAESQRREASPNSESDTVPSE